MSQRDYGNRRNIQVDYLPSLSLLYSFSPSFLFFFHLLREFACVFVCLSVR